MTDQKSLNIRLRNNDQIVYTKPTMWENSRVTFFKQSIHNIRDTGSIVPSSFFLAKKLSSAIRMKPNLKIVELGAGTGCVTKLLLKILPKDATLISIEINPVLADKLRISVKDKRCKVITGDVGDLDKILEDNNVIKADYIVSGIPLGNLDPLTRKDLYTQIKKCLSPTGSYTQFQYFLTNLAEIKRNFRVKNIAFEWRNIPPAFVYTCNLL